MSYLVRVDVHLGGSVYPRAEGQRTAPSVRPDFMAARRLEMSRGHPENISIAVHPRLDVLLNGTVHTG